MEKENSSPFFCIVIPSFNRAELLMNTLGHVLGQSYTDFHVIVVDDGSTDHTRKMLMDRYPGDSRITYLYQENKERGAARNLGFKHADCRYVVFFDSDDIMHANHLEILHREILKHDFPDFIATQFDIISMNGKHRKSDVMHLQEGFYDFHLFLNGNPIGTNVCVRKETKDLHLFPEERDVCIKEDWIFFMLNLQINRLFLVAQVTISMVDHPLRSMHQNHQQRIEQSFRAAAWLQSHIRFKEQELAEMMAHVNFLSAIHAYLADHRKQAAGFLMNAIRLHGIRKKYAILLIKIAIGHRLIRFLHA